VITRDNVTMNIDAIIYFQVTDPFRATYEVAQLLLALEKLALTTIRNIIGDMSLDDTLTSRDVINTKLKHVLDEATGKWGLQVNRVELKDINPPRDIEEAMQKQMRAEREKRATILTAEGEKQSAILQAEGGREAAIRAAEGQKLAAILRAEGEAEALRTVKQAQADTELIVLQALNKAAPSPAVIQLKYLEALAKVADGQATKLVVPLESAAFMGALANVTEGFKTP
jgi:regulator of protease activity HflC (stomatin/prohibitin superfamily)